MHPLPLIVLALVLPVGPLRGAPPELKIPPEVIPVKGYAIVRPGGDCKTVTYIGMSGEDPLPAELFASPSLFVLPTRGLAPNRYKFAAVGSLNDVHVVCEFVVVVGNVPPGPAPPGPGPGPTPPTPPDPPAPTDPLAKKVRDALAADPGTSAEKKAWALKLSGFYAAMVDFAGKDPTVGALLDDYQTAAADIFAGDDQAAGRKVIAGTRAACGAELFALAGDDAARAVDDALKGKLIDLFTRLSKALAIEGQR